MHFGFMYSGGGERTAIYESILLRRRGHEVTVFAPVIRKDACFPELIDQIELQSILPRTKVKVPFRDFVSLTASSFFTPLIARKFKGFDVILSHGQPASWIGYLVSRAFSIPHVTYLHQATRFLHPREIDLRVGWRTKPDFYILERIVDVMRPLVQTIDHTSIVSSDHVLVNSRWIATQIREYYSVDPIVCSPGVDIDRFKPRGKKHDLEIAGQTIHKPFILSTNRHYPQKGLSDLIRIYSKVRSWVDCKLVVTGGFTKHTQSLRDLSSHLGVSDDVVFTGHVTEGQLVELNQNADVYAFTSPEEDFGLGPIEAMASGTPPVVWDHAGPSETVVDRVTGLKAKPADLNDFASKLTSILKNSSFANRLGTQGARYVRRRYSWENHVDGLLDSIGDLCKV